MSQPRSTTHFGARGGDAAVAPVRHTPPMSRPVFGEQRLHLPGTGAAERLLFRAMGVADPAHYLHSLLLRRALDAWPDLRPRRILDAGCGRGDYTFYLARRYPDAQVVGVDVDVQRIERNQMMAGRLGIANARFETADLVTSRFEAPFDLIISIDVLEHIVEQEGALRNLATQLAPGGRVFFHIPTVRERPVPFSRFLTGFHEWAEHEHVADDRTAEEFEAVVRRAGFADVERRRTFGYYSGELATSLFNLPFGNSLANKAIQALIAPVCRVLALADLLQLERTRYAVAVTARAA